jgi:hypothetical protein
MKARKRLEIFVVLQVYLLYDAGLTSAFHGMARNCLVINAAHCELIINAVGIKQLILNMLYTLDFLSLH